MFDNSTILVTITLSHDMWGTDHAASIEIRGMDFLAKRIHSVKSIVGDGVKTISKSEERVREKLRG